MADRHAWPTLAVSWADPSLPPLNWADVVGTTTWDAPNLPLFSDGPPPVRIDDTARSHSRQLTPTPTITSRPPWLPLDAPPYLGHPQTRVQILANGDHQVSDLQAGEPGLAGTVWDAGRRGLVDATNETGDSLQAVGHWSLEDKATQHASAGADTDYIGRLLQKPVSEGWSDPHWWAAHIAYGGAKSYPSIALGTAGAAVGSAVTPVAGTIAGGAIGYGLGSAIQTLAPAYQRARAEGLDHDAAVSRALKETGIGAAFGAAAGAAPGASLFGRTAGNALRRPISEALAQIFGVQPGLAVGQHVANAYVEDKPITAGDLALAYAEAIVPAPGFPAGIHGPRRAQSATRIGSRPTPDDLGEPQFPNADRSRQADEPENAPLTREAVVAPSKESELNGLEPVATEVHAPMNVEDVSAERPSQETQTLSAPFVQTQPPSIFGPIGPGDPRGPQIDLVRYLSPRGVPPNIQRALDNPETIAKWDRFASEGALAGGKEYSDLGQLRERAIGEIGEDKGQKFFDLFTDFLAAAAQRSKSEDAIRNASYYQNRLAQGKGIPVPRWDKERKRLVIDERIPKENYLPSTAMQLLKIHESLAKEGLDSSKSPKTASLAQGFKGNHKPVPIDVHDVRRFGLLDARGHPMTTPGRAGYAPIERWIQDRAAEKGLTPLQYRSSVRIASAALTRLRSSTDPLIRQIARRIEITARKHGLSSEEVFRRWVRGEMPLLSLGGALAVGLATPETDDAADADPI